MKNILLLTTGGTIASAPTEDGLIPTMTGEELLQYIPQLRDICNITVHCVMKLDSSNMQPEDWVAIARCVYENIPNYDGIVITHGTDTMAYTSSMLSYMLKNLKKPVILTGSQLPILQRGSDGRQNLLDAFLTAISEIAGVYLVFNRKIIRGTRAFKMHTENHDAYVSRNYPYIGKIHNYEVILNVQKNSPTGQFSQFTLLDSISEEVFLLKLIPGIRPELLRCIIDLGYKGVVIEGFGAGGIPYFRRNLLTEVEKLILNYNIPVVLITQCPYDGTHLDIYDIGIKSGQAGVISGHDMTTEATATKLMWALGQTKDTNEVREIMITNIAGEINR